MGLGDDLLCKDNYLVLDWGLRIMLGEALALAASLCWAIGANLYRSSARSISPTTLNLVRSMSAALVLFTSVEVLGKSRYFLLLNLNSTTYLTIASLIGWALGDTLYFAGLKWIGVSRTVPLAYSYPLFILPFSALLLDERVTINIVLGSFVIVVAIWLICGSMREVLYATSWRSKLGVLAPIGAAFCWAVAVLMLKRMTAIFDPIFLAFFKMLVVIPFMTCYVAFSSKGLSQLRLLDAKALVMALAGGAIAVGLGDMIYFIGLSLVQANIVASLGASTPIFATLIAFKKERPSLRTVIGVSLVAIGFVLLTY